MTIDNFKDAAPLLFGTEFAKKSKEMVEQVKAMRSAITKKPERKPPYFQSCPPKSRWHFNRRYGRGGAQNFRQGERPYLCGKARNRKELLVHVCPKDVYQNVLITHMV